jgi:hypothetical protein
MTTKILRNRNGRFAVATLTGVVSIATLAGVFNAYATGIGTYFTPGNLVVSRSVYVNTNNIQPGVTVLPPDCSVANCPTPVTAIVDGTYPFVFNNASVDGSFGITSKIFLDQITPTGSSIRSRCPTAPRTELTPARIKSSLASNRNRK